MWKEAHGAGGAEFYNPAGADRAGEMGGAAVVALGAIRFASVAAVIKVYFLLQASCVFVLSPLGGARARSPARGAEVGPSGSARAELACERGRGWGQVELPGSSALRDVMKCCRFCRFGNFRPARSRYPVPPLDLSGGPWLAWGGREGSPGSSPGSGLPLPRAL